MLWMNALVFQRAGDEKGDRYSEFPLQNVEHFLLLLMLIESREFSSPFLIFPLYHLLLSSTFLSSLGPFPFPLMVFCSQCRCGTESHLHLLSGLSNSLGSLEHDLM